jgi:hypothetical protein
MTSAQYSAERLSVTIEFLMRPGVKIHRLLPAVHALLAVVPAIERAAEDPQLCRPTYAIRAAVRRCRHRARRW